MDLSIQMGIIYNVKNRYVIRLKFGDKLLTFLTKLVFEGKAIIYSTTNENLVLYCVGICFCGHNLAYFYNKVCITKKHHL